mgnify:CR=1 FL=1
MNLQSPTLCRVRAITAFTTLTPDAQSWQRVLADAKRQCDRLAAAFAQAGYTVQSVRIVANPFGEYLDTSSPAAAKQGLARIRDILGSLNQNGLRIRFAIGEARTAQEIALLPGLIRDHGDLSNACVNIEANADGLLDNAQILRCVEAMQEIARITPRGEGNFNFTVNFNCAPYIPYFPAGYHLSHLPNSFVIGLETPDLLVEVLKSVPKSPHNQFYADCYQAMSQALQYHVDQVLEMLSAVKLSGEFEFAGIDSSAAPSKNCSSMTKIYELMEENSKGSKGLDLKTREEIKNYYLISQKY